MGLVTIASDQLINGVASRLIYEGSVCDSWPCWNEGTCISNGSRSYRCECPLSFTGDHCQMKVSDLCEENNCSADTCWINGQNFNCSHIFKEFVTSCLSTPCLNDGKCLDTMSGHRCECVSPFHGPFCQFHKESWTYHWSIVELVLFLLVVFLIICAIAMICCSTNMGVYVSVPNKRYNRWDEEELSDENDDEDVIALGDLKKLGIRPSKTRETMLDPEAGCSNPCLDASSVVML